MERPEGGLAGFHRESWRAHGWRKISYTQRQDEGRGGGGGGGKSLNKLLRKEFGASWREIWGAAAMGERGWEERGFCCAFTFLWHFLERLLERCK